MNTAIDRYVISKVKKLRDEKDMSQREFADAINLSHGYVGDIEAGRKSAKYSLDHINEIAKVFGCKLWDLIPQEPIE